jgi:hypothetical protein
MARLSRVSNSSEDGSKAGTRRLALSGISNETGLDRVQLSVAAQVKHLRSKGNNLHAIAAKLNLPVEIVRDSLSSPTVSECRITREIASQRRT